jgi:hypothetical protein
MNSISRIERERMKDYIDKMDPNEHSQILNIIKKYTDNFTKTQTGILISTENLNDECMKEIDTYIHFSIDQRKRIDDDNKQRKTYERMVQ